MEENKAFQMSKSICKIYRKLATLEKEEKKDTPKWKEMFSMLVLSKKYEEEDYTNSPRESELEERKLNLKEGQFTDFIFEITPEVLTSMRILNKLPRCKQTGYYKVHQKFKYNCVYSDSHL